MKYAAIFHTHSGFTTGVEFDAVDRESALRYAKGLPIARHLKDAEMLTDIVLKVVPSMDPPRPPEPKFDRTAATARLINIRNADPGKATVVQGGNIKVGKIPTANLRPISDCTNCSACAETCYAMKAMRVYPSVRVSLTRNSALLRTDTTAYFDRVRAYLRKKSPEFFRIHSSGDFITPAHFRGWLMVAREFPGVSFLAFTKSYTVVSSALALEDAPVPANFSLVLSVFPGMDPIPSELAHLPRAYAGEPDDYAGDDRDAAEEALHCPGACENCLACWALARRGLDVRFSIH